MKKYYLPESFFNVYADDFPIETPIPNVDNIIGWNEIFIYQKFSEDFIRKHADKINWKLIAKYQALSEELIEEHADEID